MRSILGRAWILHLFSIKRLLLQEIGFSLNNDIYLCEKLQPFYCQTKTDTVRKGWGTELRDWQKKELKP